jgi:hypothetical protein
MKSKPFRYAISIFCFVAGFLMAGFSIAQNNFAEDLKIIAPNSSDMSFEPVVFVQETADNNLAENNQNINSQDNGNFKLYNFIQISIEKSMFWKNSSLVAKLIKNKAALESTEYPSEETKISKNINIKASGLSCIKIPANILVKLKGAPTPPDGKKKDGKLICHVLAEGKKDNPHKSKKNPKGEWGGCCYDPDEVPNPNCCYPVGSVYEKLLNNYFKHPFPLRK